MARPESRNNQELYPLFFYWNRSISYPKCKSKQHWNGELITLFRRISGTFDVFPAEHQQEYVQGQQIAALAQLVENTKFDK